MVRPNGSRRRIEIGPYPVVSLADARRRAMEVARDVELGEFEKAPEVSEASAPTLGETIPEFIELHAKPNTRDWNRTESVLHRFDGSKDRPRVATIAQTFCLCSICYPNDTHAKLGLTSRKDVSV
ncbi:Arm DNA-binding domain-containing protein [Aliiroseovarius crassostreae]|uniref:Arm DNA-binding domain-containing protein n=1 Tax=Aliiroseovarius crassostreae TaxID=154981 RepID=UPI003C7CC1F0